MKKWIWLICTVVLLMFAGSSAAEDKPAAEAASLFQAAFPSHQTALSDQCGHTAVAVLSDGRVQVLCIADEKNGAWEIVVSNPAALRQDAAVASLLLDTDETLFWSYSLRSGIAETCHAV